MTTMTTKPTLPTNHHHAFNFHTGRPRFHFDEPPPPTPPPPSAAWHEGVAPEVKGFWQIKGIPLDDPKASATKLTEMYQQAEKFIGVSPDQIIRVPKSDAKPEDIRAYHERLGAPKEAKDYDLAAVADTSMAEALRAAAHSAGVSKDAASAIGKAVAKVQSDAKEQQNTLDAAKLAEQKASLQKNWGDKFAYNHLQAIEGARRLGITPEGVKALEGQIGYDAVMEAMRKIGANTRESDFIVAPGPNNGEVTTVEGAKAKKAELMADPSFVTKYNAGDPAAKREMTRLNEMIVGAAA